MIYFQFPHLLNIFEYLLNSDIFCHLQSYFLFNSKI